MSCVGQMSKYVTVIGKALAAAAFSLGIGTCIWQRQSLLTRFGHLNNKKWGWKCRNILALMLGLVKHTHGSHTCYFGLTCAPPSRHREEKDELSLQREISPNYNNSEFLSEEELSEAGPGMKDKRKTVHTRNCFTTFLQSFPKWSNFSAIYPCKKENTAHLSRL